MVLKRCGGRKILHTSNKYRVKSLCFSKDNSFLAAGDENGMIHVWRTATWEPAATSIRLQNYANRPIGGTCSIDSISFVAHDEHEFLVAADRNVYILKWNPPCDECTMGTFESHDMWRVQLYGHYPHDNVRTIMCISKCGTYLAIGHDTSQTPYDYVLPMYAELTVYQFDKTTLTFENKLQLPSTIDHSVQHLCFGGPQNKFLLASSNSVTPVVLWNTEHQTKIIIPFRSVRDTDSFGSIFGGFDDRFVMTVLVSTFETGKKTFIVKHDISWFFQEGVLTKWFNQYLQFVLQLPEVLCNLILEFAGLSWTDITCPILGGTSNNFV